VSQYLPTLSRAHATTTNAHLDKSTPRPQPPPCHSYTLRPHTIILMTINAASRNQMLYDTAEHDLRSDIQCQVTCTTELETPDELIVPNHNGASPTEPLSRMHMQMQMLPMLPAPLRVAKCTEPALRSETFLAQSAGNKSESQTIVGQSDGQHKGIRYSIIVVHPLPTNRPTYRNTRSSASRAFGLPAIGIVMWIHDLTW